MTEKVKRNMSYSTDYCCRNCDLLNNGGNRALRCSCYNCLRGKCNKCPCGREAIERLNAQ